MLNRQTQPINCEEVVGRFIQLKPGGNAVKMASRAFE
jgi:hypothetical protein